MAVLQGTEVALSSLEDVKRVLRIPASDTDDVRDAQLRAALDAVESQLSALTWKLSAAGPQMETYYDVQEDATLRLPADDVTVTQVKVYEYPSSYGIPLSPIELGLGHGYDITDTGNLYLRPVLTISPFEGATAQRRLRAYARVEVHYIGTGVIPRAVTEGVAYLAAGWWQDGPRSLQGLLSEKIGDYSYTAEAADPDGVPSFWGRGMMMIKPFLKTSRVAVV